MPSDVEMEPDLECPEMAAKKQNKKAGRKKPMLARVEAAQGLQVGWEEVSLDDIDDLDKSLQFRLSAPTAELRRSLIDDGQQLPVDLLGSNKPYKVIDGFTRIRIARELGWTKVKAFRHDIDAGQALRMAFSRNVVRRNLRPMERANALWVAQKQGIKKSELTEVFGISAKQVARYLELLDFTPAIQRNLDGTVITMAHAKVLADFQVDDVAQWKKRIVDEELDARALKKLIRKECGMQVTGRRRNYIKTNKASIRGYPFVLDKNTPRLELERGLKALEDAAEAVKKLVSGAS